MVYAETGTLEIERLVHLRMCNYWCRIITGSSHKLSSVLYKLTRSLHYNENVDFRSPWIEKLQSVFDSAGLSHLWRDEMGGLTSSYINASLKLRLNDI